jgi:sporulation protein YlmC with PRC-barrel domain
MTSTIRRRGLPAIVLAAGLGFGLGVPYVVSAQIKPVALVVVNVKTVALGYRASQLIGRTVVNDKGENIGKIDDLVVGRDKVLFAIIGVGGFLGIGQKLIVAPYNSLTVTSQRIVLPGASKEALGKLPAFRYGA